MVVVYFDAVHSAEFYGGIVAAFAKVVAHHYRFVKRIAVFAAIAAECVEFIIFSSRDVERRRASDKHVVALQNLADERIHLPSFKTVGVVGEFFVKRGGRSENGKRDQSRSVIFDAVAVIIYEI